MSTYLFQIQLLAKRLALVYIMYSLCRLLFLAANKLYFPEVGMSELSGILFYGLRFDTFSIMVSNCLFILISILPFSFVTKPLTETILKWIFMISNSVFILINCVDLVYFKFTKKRSTSDLSDQVFGGQTDVLKQIPDYIRDFWWLFLLYFAMVFLLAWVYKKIKVKRLAYKHNSRSVIACSLSMLFIIGMVVIGIRGGLQRIPIDLVDAGLHTEPQNVALVLNTPFTMIKSVGEKQLEELHFMDDAAAEKFADPIKTFGSKPFTNENLIILELESFSKEYTGIGNRKSYTPFFDSLMKHSLVFTNAWANGTRSIEGIPSILSGVPTLMNNSYINSPYCNNKLNSLPSLLKRKGYGTYFFHGGLNGTMNFDSYAKTAGFDKYFGKDEYNNDADFDGNWGIWDEPYLNYCANKLNETKQPFFASIFTLSSHHPYQVPEKYKGKFPTAKLEILESIGYADYSLRQFFNAAKKMPWFNNTLFVLVADHTSISDDYFYANNTGQHCIPIVFFKPDNSLAGKNNTLIQHIDILPSVLDKMGYDESFFSFGKSVFSASPSAYAIFYDSGNYYLANDSMYFGFNGFKATQAVKFTHDSILAKNLVKYEVNAVKNAENYLKSYMQFYSHSLLQNNAYFQK